MVARVGCRVFQTLGDNFAGDRMETRTSLFAETTLLNFWSSSHIVCRVTADDERPTAARRPAGAAPTETLHSGVRALHRRAAAADRILELQRTTDVSGRSVAQRRPRSRLASAAAGAPARGAIVRRGPPDSMCRRCRPLADRHLRPRYVFADVGSARRARHAGGLDVLTVAVAAAVPAAVRLVGASSRASRSSRRRARSRSRSTGGIVALITGRRGCTVDPDGTARLHGVRDSHAGLHRACAARQRRAALGVPAGLVAVPRVVAAAGGRSSMWPISVWPGRWAVRSPTRAAMCSWSSSRAGSAGEM
jgi:hypothetical protein